MDWRTPLRAGVLSTLWLAALSLVPAALATAGSAAGEWPRRVPGMAAIGGSAGAAKKATRTLRRESIPLALVLGPPADPGVGNARVPQTKRVALQVGHGRDIPQSLRRNLRASLVWEPRPDGSATARFSVRSPGARALRVAIDFQVADDVEVRFFGLGAGRETFRARTAKELRARRTRRAAGRVVKPGGTAVEPIATHWSPVVDGDAVGVELYVPGGIPRAGQPFDVRITQVSHFTYSVSEFLYKLDPVKGASGTCNIDVACVATRPTNLSRAVAKLVFNIGGSAFLCSGTLLNDADTGNEIPYLMTAEHCINSQAVASTLNTFWFFQNRRCDGDDASAVVQRTGGADLLAHGFETDFSLLQLHDSVPGAYFAGWSRSVVPPSSAVIGIHHPLGDVKKWSAGIVTGLAPYLGEVNGEGSHLRVVWSQGTTEPGSSGSGIFNPKGDFIGNLQGGFASCTDTASPDWYGRFDKSYPRVKRWLAQVPPLIRDGTKIGGTISESQWREYRLLVSESHTSVIVELKPPTGGSFTADIDLYVRRGSRPSLLRQDCYSGATMGPERCVLENSAAQFYYMGVYGAGLGATAYQLEVKLLPPGTKGMGGSDSVGVFDPERGFFHLRDPLSTGNASRRFRFGPRGSRVVPVAGNLGPNGQDSVAIYSPRKGLFHLRQQAIRGAPHRNYRYGPRGGRAIPLLGDWNGNGERTLGVYIMAAGRFSLKYRNARGPGDRAFKFGPVGVGAQPISGDWNGDGIDTVGVYLPGEARFLLTDAHKSLPVSADFRFGPVKDGLLAIAGDWDGDGIDTVAVYDPLKKLFRLTNSNSRWAEHRFRLKFDGEGGLPVAGDWDGR